MVYRLKTKREQQILESLGLAIRERRLARNISQEELAALSSLHRTFLSDIERGVGNLTFKSLLKIAKAIDLEPSALMKMAEQKQDKEHEDWFERR